ncbi:hypothetical protein Pcinc_024147 [Petrolisthes cinctipes]|uniref:Uncharacterized protein n=1 Tax=Petrolisthes cinctipes TaxID=88211 RepID=A0AAE1KDE6_PETCI|nr:hypothetical protein Pcinc_024147 [Petrolisthes cinctipes]
MKVRTQACVLVMVGVVLIAGSTIFYLSFSKIFTKMLEKKLMLVPGSQTLENFKSPPVPIFMQFYLFNITNSNEVLQGATPVVQQIGPYTFEEKQLKYNLTFSDDGGLVTYVQNKSFYFREDMTPGSLTDSITTINAVMMSLGAKLATAPAPLKVIIQMWFTRFSEKPFVTKPVRELLFEGYEEPLLLQLATLTNDPLHATGRFGFFYPKNNTNDGNYTVKTGVLGMEDYQYIMKWRGEERINFWKTDMWGGDTCNMINGTSGNQFPRPVTKSTLLELYTAELCRSIFAEYQREVSHGPLTLYRYVLPNRLLAKAPENDCYCNDNFTCRASMINVSPCRKGAPVVMSTPHFYQGEPEDSKQVMGLNPSEEEHETYLDIEPTTGVTFRAAKRIQVNMPLHRYGNLPAYQDVPDVIIPVLWVNESVEVPLERTYALHRTLTLPFTLVTVAVAVLITLGMVLILVAVIKLILSRRPKTKNRKPAKEKEQSVTEKLNNRNYS